MLEQSNTAAAPLNRKQRRNLAKRGRVTKHLRTDAKTDYNKSISAIVIRGSSDMSPQLQLKHSNLAKNAWANVQSGTGGHSDIVELLVCCGTIAEIAALAHGDDESRALWTAPVVQAREAIKAMMYRHLETEVLEASPEALRWVPEMIELYVSEVLPNISLLQFTKSFDAATVKLIDELNVILKACPQ